MAKIDVKVNLETLLEGKPIELEFVQQAIREKMGRMEKERGIGCPANNTACRYLHQNICIHLHPEISVIDGETICDSLK